MRPDRHSPEHRAALQWLADKVVRHLAEQGEKAMSEAGRCAYRGRGGTKCAVGCLLDDMHYDVELENRPVSHELVREALQECQVIQPGMFGDLQVQLLRAFQDIHDGRPVAEWERRLGSLLEWWSLAMPEVNWDKCKAG